MENQELNLYPKNSPSIESGNYEIIVTQEVTIDGVKETYQNSSTYQVESSGFYIDSQIDEIFPSNGSTGQYASFIPHITFNNKALPWERGDTPWFALLTLYDGEEFLFKSDSNFEESQNNIYEVTTFSSLKDTKFSLIELPVELYKKIAPSCDELKYLAHVREVTLCSSQSSEYLQNRALLSTENNAPAISVILANRLPKVGLNTIVLVSVDRLKKDLSEAKNKKVQLIVLKKWSFVCDNTDENFVSYLKENIKAGDFKLEYDGDTKPDEIKNIIDQGYVPLKNNPDSENIEFYRGPLMPIFLNQSEIEYEKKSPAYQLGRLLCLQNKGIAEAIFNNRVSNLRIAMLQNEMNNQEEKFSTKLKQGSNEKSTSKELQLNALTDLLKTFNSFKIL